MTLILYAIHEKEPLDNMFSRWSADRLRNLEIWRQITRMRPLNNGIHHDVDDVYEGAHILLILLRLLVVERAKVKVMI